LGNDNTCPPLATASAVAQAHWRRRPQNRSRAASPCLRQPACNGARAEQPLWWCRGLLSAQFSPAAAAAPSPPLATASAVTLAQRRRRTRNKAQEAAPGHAQCRCTKNRGQRGAAAAPGGRTWPATAPPAAPTGALALLRAPLLVPSGASVRGTKPRKLPQAAPSAAAPRTGVREEQQPRQGGAPGLRRVVATAHTCSANGGSSAAPRPAARAQRRLRARNKAQEDALGASWCRCTKNRGQRGAAAAPEGRIWPATAPPAAPKGALALLRAPLLVPSDATLRGTKPREVPLVFWST